MKKYSFGFDVYDFTVKIFGEKYIKIVDIEEQEIKKSKKK